MKRVEVKKMKISRIKSWEVATLLASFENQSDIPPGNCPIFQTPFSLLFSKGKLSSSACGKGTSIEQEIYIYSDLGFVIYQLYVWAATIYLTSLCITVIICKWKSFD